MFGDSACVIATRAARNTWLLAAASAHVIVAATAFSVRTLSGRLRFFQEQIAELPRHWPWLATTDPLSIDLGDRHHKL